MDPVTAATLTREKYVQLCDQQNVLPLQYVFAALEESIKPFLLSSSNDLKIDLSGNNKLLISKVLEDSDIDPICTALQTNLMLTCLDLRYNSLTDRGAKAVAKLIRESPTLIEINMMCNEITGKGAKDIANALYMTKHLKSLKMNGNKIGDMGGLAFARALERNTTIQLLDLGDCDLKIDSIIALLRVLHDNVYLKSLNLNRPLLFSLEDEIFVHISNMLKVNQNLAELHLEKFGMGDTGILRICQGLKVHRSLSYLDLRNNRISRDGAVALSNVLLWNETLKVLDLGNNRIGCYGAMAFALTLSKDNHTLTTLSLVGNSIESKGMIAIANALETNTTLSSLYIWGNTLDDKAKELYGNLIHKQRLKLENVDVKPFIVDGETQLAQLSHGIDQFYYWKPTYGLGYISKSDDSDDTERCYAE